MYRLTTLVYGLLICAALSGCQGGTDGSADGTVSGYKRFLDGEFARIKETTPQLALDGTYKLDVKKSDSLVSPLIGTCVVDVFFPYTDKDMIILFSITLEISHGWQEGKWVMTTGKGTIKGGKVVKDEGEHQVASKLAEKFKGRHISFETLDALGEHFD